MPQLAKNKANHSEFNLMLRSRRPNYCIGDEQNEVFS
jgi:hypothetical protein